MIQSEASESSSSLAGHENPTLVRDELLPEVFEAAAREHPEKTAIIFGDVMLTYSQLDGQANRVAQALRAKGIGRGSFVGLWYRRSLDLHIAMLGILKAGAAYLPFDGDAPPERIAECLGDCDAPAILLDAEGRQKAEGKLPAKMFTLAELFQEDPPASAVDRRALGCLQSDPAYAIYTSGSTGKPKGIVIEHRNICHYLRSANTVYGIREDDVCFQGASVAFDLSLEEIFIPYSVGATLWVASPAVLGETEKLPDVLSSAGITVLDTVPTLLGMMNKDVPSLRVIILGGEACPPAIAARWCKPGRSIFNSYGPTEATVVATIDEVRIGEPVSIGLPIPNYTCYVADEGLRLLPRGAEGELLIGGPGVARGYLKRPELTEQKFIRNPFRNYPLDPVLYRTGDAVSIGENGKILFHGRLDDQVKIRGFRVELGEIEARLSHLEGVAQGAVVLRKEGDIDRLIAFVVPEPGMGVDAKALRTQLRAQLPPYMVPSHFEQVAELPRLTSGKTDRKALRVLPLSQPAETEAQEEPETPTEGLLLEAAKKIFPGQAIPFEADFFTDLGGHSLLAASFVAELRENPAMATVTLEDVYGNRTLRAIAAKLDARAAQQTGPARDFSFDPPPWARRFLCGLAQAACLPLLLTMLTAPWLGVFVSYEIASADQVVSITDVFLVLGIYASIRLALMAFALVGKRLVLWRTRPGRYPLWGVYFFRWWLAKHLAAHLQMAYMQGSPIAAATMRALGAKVGKDVIVGDFEAGALDLIEIGDGVTLGSKMRFANAEVIGNELIIGRIHIEDDAYIGTSCVISHDCRVGRGAELGDLTALMPATSIPAGELWNGSPAAKVGVVAIESVEPATASPLTKALQTAYYAALVIFMPSLSLLPIFPAFYLFDRYDTKLQEIIGIEYHWYLPVLTWPTAMLMVLGTVLLVAAMRWLILPKAAPGKYSIYSGFYVRKWTVGLASEVMLETLSSLFSTLYMRSWYCLMGAKIGKNTEIATNFAGRYDTIEVGERCFVADEVVIGDEDLRKGWMEIKKVRVGNGVFIGNDSVLPPGSDIPDGCLIGIKSKPPTGERMEPGQTWFGSPPIKLPVRQRFDHVDGSQTFRPPLWRWWMRAIFELFSISMPTMMFITLGTFAAEYVLFPALESDDGVASFLGLFVATSVVSSLVLAAVVLALKWIVMGTYKPGARGLWSWWAIRTESTTTLYWGTAGQVLLDSLSGTPMLPWALRLFGAKIGKGVYLDSTDITEFDCVEIGDFAVVNSTANLQTHLYEDRVMKVGTIRLGKGVVVGALSTVLYDTKVGDFARLGPLTLVMKGESIPANTSWTGAPAQPVSESRE